VFYLIVTAEDNAMLSTSNNDYHYNEREKKVLELYKNGKNTRDIAKEQRLSLEDISIILKKHGVNHGIAMIDDDDDNKKSHSNNEKATQATSYSLEERSPYKWQSN
jgi:DNA-binding NarL/FixJ family response regulator